MTTTAVIAGENVQGNVSNCKYENIMTDSGRKSLLQFYTKQKYSVVNVCDKSVLSTYEEFRFTPEILIGTMLIVLVGIGIRAIFGK